MFDAKFRRALVSAAALSLFASLVAPARAADEFAVSAAQMQALGVQVQALAATTDVAGLAYPARVVLPPKQQQVLSAPLPGVVDQLLVSENEAVKAGQPLVRLQSPELGELQLKLMEAAARNGLASKTLQREKQLLAEGIIPERRVQEAESAAAEALARQRQAEAALRLAGLDDSSIRRIAGGSTVDSALVLRARNAGRVTELTAKPGQRVQQADALLQVVDGSRVWLDVQVPLARQAEVSIAKGAKVSVVGRQEVAATVQSIGATVNDGQALTLRAEVNQGALSLKPGEFVQVRLPFSASAEGFAVPQGAVARQDDKAYVFVRTATGFIAKQVTILASGGQSLRVKGDLKAGQQIAVASVIALKAAWQGKGGGS